MIAFAEHAAIDAFDVVDGALTVGGESVDALARRVGSTPFYAYSSGAIAARVAALRKVLPAGTRLQYAIKANPHDPLVRFMRAHVDGVDCASAREVRQAVAAGYAPDTVGFAGPGKSAADFDAALDFGVTVTLESTQQLLDLAERAKVRGMSRLPGAAIRVNPRHALRASGMTMGAGGPSAFGVDEETVPDLIERATRLGIPIVGLHVYAGSQNLSGEHVAAAIEANGTAALDLMRAHASQPWQWLNLGGGFGVPYTAGEKPIDLAPVAVALRAVAARIAVEHASARLRLELGRYLVADAGVYVCRVIEKKVSRGTVFCVTDGGLHHNLAATGNFGQVIKRAYPIAVAARVDPSLATVRADVVGPLCTPLDCFGRGVRLAPFERGDLIVVFRSGAYGPSASPAAFLGHPECHEVLTD